MKVQHPRAGDAPLPSVITVEGVDYRISDDGVVDAPEADARRIAEAWARDYGVTPDDVVYEEDGPPDREQTPAVDPGDLTVADLREEVRDIEDADALRAIEAAERDGKNRKTALRLLRRLIDEVDE
jgi:hypothetical protein